MTDGLDPDVFGTAPGMIAMSFDATSYLERKFSAFAAHRSAFGVTQEMLRDPPPGIGEMLDAFRLVFEQEVFVLEGARVPAASWPLQHFFDGLETAKLDRGPGSVDHFPA